jgi:uncharacterized protein
VAAVYHAGELAVQRRAGVETIAQRVGLSIKDAMPPAAQAFAREQPLAVVASMDEKNNVWASLLVGTSGFMEPLDERTLRINVKPFVGDPLAANLHTHSAVGLLLIDVATRRRMRLNGDAVRQDDGTLLVQAQQVYANCPKYIQARDLSVNQAATTVPSVQHGTQLTPEQHAWIARADTFFIATAHPERGADASHRGGNGGFVRVADAQTLLFPDYAGNTMFQTLGNIQTNGRVGLLFVDYASGSLLQLTGSAEILWDAGEAALFAGAERVVRFVLTKAIELTGASSLRAAAVDYSPFNPA